MTQAKKQPNILFIMSDDHAAHAIGCYGSRINQTPHLDRIGGGGMRFDNCFCTNSICTPSRAAILTGTYNHINGVTTLATMMDNRLSTFPKLLQGAGYQTALFGKWHLGEGPRHNPTGFDEWAVLPGQGFYHNPTFIFPDGAGGGVKRTVPGYTTDLIADMCLDWLDRRDPAKPFCLLCHHKAPHRPWYPDEKHAGLFLNEEVPEPDTLQDDYRNRAQAAAAAAMRVGVHMNATDLKCELPDDMHEADLRRWAYQRYIKDYLRVVQSVDDNVGRLLDYLDAQGLAEDTLVVYTSDQGFFLGDHGWYDKRFMYEESLRMPLLMRYPQAIAPGSTNDDLVLNVDFPALFLDLAGVAAPTEMQGRSFRPLLAGSTPPDWRETMYYRYWMNAEHHNVAAHYGIRTQKHKLIYYYYDGCGQPGTAPPAGCIPLDFEPEWELFDLERDPHELKNVVRDPAYAGVFRELRDELHRLQAELGDTRHPSDVS
ncbi:MAG: sulfatase [Candidatus Marinimicrobia bacterium]|nr:sulfatase [Candidatus Neomarinimicrobiota bacterium]